MTPPGIDPETVQIVAQCLNHYATPDPGILVLHIYIYIYIYIKDKTRIKRNILTIKQNTAGSRHMSDTHVTAFLVTWIERETSYNIIQPLKLFSCRSASRRASIFSHDDTVGWSRSKGEWCYKGNRCSRKKQVTRNQCLVLEKIVLHRVLSAGLEPLTAALSIALMIN